MVDGPKVKKNDQRIMTNKMKFLILGCGAIGQRHISNLKKVSKGKIIVCDTNHDRLKKVGQKYEVDTFLNFDDALEQNINTVIVSTPPSQHISVALAAARKGCNLFIEKPLSDNLNGVAELIDISEKKKIVIFMGFNFRFQYGLRKVKTFLKENTIGRIVSARAEFAHYLPDWHPGENYRKNYSARKILGGGSILDAIHEIDYIRWLLGEVGEIFCFSEKISDLDIDTEDIAEIVMRLKTNQIISIHMDYVRRIYNRSCEIIGEKGIINWNFQERTVRLYSLKNKTWQIFHKKEDTNEMYLEEMKHFILCLQGKARPEVNIFDGKRNLEIALAARKSARNKCVVPV